MVDENFRVGGSNNIFAIGDITDFPVLKQDDVAQRHALLVAKNLKLLIKVGKESKLIKYKTTSAKAMVSLGRKDALAQYRLATIFRHLRGMIRSRDLFIGKTRKQIESSYCSSFLQLNLPFKIQCNTNTIQYKGVVVKYIKSQKTVWNLWNVFVCMYINWAVKLTESCRGIGLITSPLTYLKKMVSIPCQMVMILGIKSRHDYKRHHIKHLRAQSLLLVLG